tara:strand:+ start:167 stop:763 length:597 start_codon:yes stop_codon:yes gene_type:complete
MESKKKHINKYFYQVSKIAQMIDKNEINELVKNIVKIKRKSGRIFFLGVGGSAGNSSHAVNDFRKLCNIEAYTPTDNVSELTARINDEGWNYSFVDWLKVSKFNSRDAIFIFSVGGGNKIKNVSTNLIKAIDFVLKKKGKIFGIVGKKDGYTKKKGHNVLVVPLVDKKLITPHSEAFQAVIWHCLVSHPDLQSNKTKW